MGESLPLVELVGLTRWTGDLDDPHIIPDGLDDPHIIPEHTMVYLCRVYL